MTNARSIVHKTEELELLVVENYFVWDCGVTIVTETCLHSLIPESAVQLMHHSMHRCRNDSFGKTREGGLCIYLHQGWCTNSRVVNTHCSPDLETMTVMCRPYYLQRELTAVLVTAVYIAPDVSVNTVLSQLHDVISRQQRAHPEGAFIVAGDFNRACLKTVLLKFMQYEQGPPGEETY